MVHTIRSDAGRAVGAALLLNLAYPPFHLVVPSFVALVPVVLPFYERRSGHAVRGAVFGAMWSAMLFHWMAVAMWRFRPSALPLLLIVAAGFGIATGLAFALTGWILRRTTLPVLLVFPLVWTALDTLAGLLGPLALPWLGLGTSLTGFPLLIQVADFGGARVITFLLAMANTALAAAWFQRRQPAAALLPILGVLGGVGMVASYGFMRIATTPLREVGRVTVVQPNIRAEEKWNPTLQDSLVQATLALSRDAAARDTAALIVWPELALPLPLEMRPSWASGVRRHVADSDRLLLAGSIERTVDENAHTVTYNTGVLFSPHDPPQMYRKERLVPVFERFNGTNAGGPGVPFRTAFGNLGVLICNEATFSDLAQARRRQGADILVTLSNDAWFTSTTAASQAAAHLVMRAIETRIGIVRAGNTGPSGFIDPLGRRYGWLDEDVRGAVTRPVFSTAVVPPASRADWVGVLSFGGVALMGMWGVIARAAGAERGALADNPKSSHTRGYSTVPPASA